MKPVFKKYLWLSFFGHMILSGVLFLFHKMDRSLFSKKTVLAPSLRVTMTALPEKTLPKPKKKIKKPAPLPIKTKTPSKAKPKPEKKKEEDSSEKQDQEQTSPQEVSQEEPPKGNQPSEGLSEEEQNAQQIVINTYLIEIIERVKRNWNLPKYLTDQSFRAELEIKINAQGKVTEKKIITSSQNEIVDGKVLKAIELSEPFPPPPELVQQLIEDGIVFQLNSREEF
ncbi:MAG: energy transducer TonB [Bdellovibrionales bacterium]|nr:energy transducer TonB [Bdellovibrionales bacterium]